MPSHYNDPISSASSGYSRNAGGASSNTKQLVAATIQQRAIEFGLTQKDVANLIAIAKVETGFNPDAAAQGSWTSASGVFQITDSTARDAAARLNGSARINNIHLGTYDRFNVDSNVDYGIAVYLDKKARAQSEDVGDIYKKWNSNPEEYNKYLDSLRNDSNKYLDNLKSNTPIKVSQVESIDYATNTKDSDTAYNYFSDGKLKSLSDHWLKNDNSASSEMINFIDNGSVGSILDTNISAQGEKTGYFTGVGDSISLDHTILTLAADSHVSVFGEGNSYTSTGTGIWANLSGSDAHVNFTQTGNVVGLTGHNETYNGAANTVWLNAGSNGNIIGANNRVVMNGAGNYAEINGSNTQVEGYGTGQRIGLTGDNQRVTASSSDVWFHAGADGALIGNNNTLVANGQNIQAFAYGSDTRLISSSSGNTFTLNGERQSVTATGDNVWFAPGTDGGIYGNNNTAVANGGDIQMQVIGDHLKVISTTGGNTVTVGGADITINASNDSIWYNSNSLAVTYGDNNTVVENGNRILGNVIGDNSVIISQGENNQIQSVGRNVTIYAENDHIVLGGSGITDAKIYGHGNSFVGHGLFRVRFMDEPERNLLANATSPLTYADYQEVSRITSPAITPPPGPVDNTEIQIVGSPPISFVPGPHFWG